MRPVLGSAEGTHEEPVAVGGSEKPPFAKALGRVAVLSLQTMVTGIFTVAISSVLMILALFGRADAARRTARHWNRILVGFYGVEWVLRGNTDFLIKGGSVMVANHCDRFDGPCLFLAMDGQFDFAISRRLSLTPFWGQAMLALGFIPIDRWNAPKGRRRINGAVESVRRGRRVLFFPEGRRVGGHRLLPFKTGAFHLAIAAGVPVVPIAITAEGLTSFPGFRSGRKRLVLTIGDPIPTTGLDDDDTERLAGRSREAIETMLNPCERVGPKDSQIRPRQPFPPQERQPDRPGAPDRVGG